AVGLVAAGREHEHRHLAGGADFLQHLEAIHARQHHVENDGMPLLIRRNGALGSLSAVVYGGDIEAERLEVGADEAAQLPVVINHQEARAAGRIRWHQRKSWIGAGSFWSPGLVGERLMSGVASRKAFWRRGTPRLGV